MESIQRVNTELNSLKNDVIGVYKHSKIGVFELVLKINKDAETIETVFISQFGAIQRGFSIPYQQGQLIMFPQGKNMNQILDNPFEWDAFIKSFS